MPSVHDTLRGWNHCPISQMTKLKQMCTCSGRCRKNGQLPPLARLLCMGPVTSAQFPVLASGTNPSPSQIIPGCFIVVLSSLPPRKMSRLSFWRSLCCFLLALISVLSIGTLWHLLLTSSWMQLFWCQSPHEASDPMGGLEWNNFNRSLLPAS